MRISDWSSDVCSSDLQRDLLVGAGLLDGRRTPDQIHVLECGAERLAGANAVAMIDRRRGGPFDGRRLRQILITHLLVRLEAAARENPAVLGLIAQRLAVVFDDDADDAAVLFAQLGRP